MPNWEVMRIVALWSFALYIDDARDENNVVREQQNSHLTLTCGQVPIAVEFRKYLYFQSEQITEAMDQQCCYDGGIART